MILLIGVIQKERYNTMENKIVLPEMEKPKEPTATTLAEVEKLNNQLSTKDGKWVYSNEHGIVWAPNFEDDMGRGTPPPVEPPPSILGELVEWGKTLDLDGVKENSVMIVKLSPKNPVASQYMQEAIVNMVLAPRSDRLKDKKLTVLFMTTEDSIELIEERDMEQAGWVKKKESVIISPFK